MTKWEYKCVPLDRRGTKEDFSFSWTYGPWELAAEQGGKKLLPAGLDELGRQGWELAGVLPSDLWSEGTRSGNASHGVRTISCILLFKRPAKEAADCSAKPPAAATASPATASPTATSPPGSSLTAPSVGGPPDGVSPDRSPTVDTLPGGAPEEVNPPATTPSDSQT